MKKTIFPIIVLALLVLGWLLLSTSQQQPLIKIGVLQFTNNNATTLAGFKLGMAEAGLRENKEIIYLFAGPVQDRSSLEAAVQQLLKKQPDLIFVSTTPATRAVKDVTAQLAPDLPVVFAPVNDPVAAEIVINLQRPEANLTGVRLASSEGRRLQALSNTFHTVKRIFVPFTPQDKAAEASLAELQKAAPKLGISLLPVPFAPGSSIDEIRGLVPAAADAILLPREGRVMSRSKDFAAVAIEHKLPLSVARFSQAEVGGLIGYGFVGPELGKQAARLARQILRGTPVINLPVETARDYLFINLDTAAAMDLTLPESALRRAHFLIQDQQKIENL